MHAKKKKVGGGGPGLFRMNRYVNNEPVNFQFEELWLLAVSTFALIMPDRSN